MIDAVMEDDNAPVEPFRQKKRKSRPGDRLLVLACFALAGVSAAFPWYVFFNAEKFGIRTVDIGRTRDLPPVAGRPVVSVSPLAMADSTPDEKKPPVAVVDDITTATASALGKERQNGAARLEQPFPGRGAFRLLHVANGRALIEDRSGMYMVRIGSVLPDQSRLAALEERDGRWVLVTSRGEVYADAASVSPSP